MMILNEARNLEQYAPAFVAKIVRRTEKVPGHMIMVMNFEPVILLRVKRSFIVLTYATDCRRIEFHLLIPCEALHCLIDF